MWLGEARQVGAFGEWFIAGRLSQQRLPSLFPHRYCSRLSRQRHTTSFRFAVFWSVGFGRALSAQRAADVYT